MSNLLVYIVTWFVLHISSGDNESQIGPSDAPKFQIVVWIGLSVGLLCSLVFHFLVKEGNDYGGNNVRAGQIRTNIAELLCSKEIYQVIFIFYGFVNKCYEFCI